MFDPSEETTSLTKALIKEDKELDMVLQPSALKSAPIDDDDDNETWDPDEDSSSDSEAQNKWYKKLVKEYFVGSEQNFAKARELYKTVRQATDSKKAVFYKLKDKNTISDTFDRIERIFTQWLLNTNHTQTNELRIEELRKRLTEAAAIPTAQKQDIKIVDGLLKNIEEIKKFFLNKEINQQNIQEMFMQLKLKEITLEKEYKEFFNINMTQEEMKMTGALYCPGILHCWGTNLSWALGHIQKGSMFLVGANIVQNKFRRTIDSQQEHSAFLREICIALKVGYTLSSRGGKIALQPLGLSRKYLQNLDTTAKPGNGINPSYDEIEHFFTSLKKYIEHGKDFDYRYETLELQRARLHELSTEFISSPYNPVLQPVETTQTPNAPLQTMSSEKEERSVRFPPISKP